MVKVPGWIADALSRSRTTPPHTTPLGIKSVMLGEVLTFLEGAADDPYFQAIEGQAAALAGLAALIARQVPHGSTVIDVGANIGLSTILLARKAERVIAFEPSPINTAFLLRNLERNGVTNVEVHAAAASSKPGMLRFHVAQFGAGSHVVAAGHVSGSTIPTVDVPAVTLDGTDLPPIAFIKIDAEGHEPDVLAGARRMLAQDRPLIYTEINIWCLSAFAGHSPGALVRKLWEVFEVGSPKADGQVSPLPDGYGFLHDMVAHTHGIADLVLRPKEGVPMPSLPELVWPASALAALQSGLMSELVK
ncbi:FkbM family methyltransferase [Rhodopila sp.]|uniref:FkbM family methyltransferase n=1 Tax=Rhodopila sp. TaxID=2480087 RepID=UPI003D11DC7B